MPAVQQYDRVNFATARLFENVAGGLGPVCIANLTDVNVDLGIELKQAYGEFGFPIGVADGHRSVKISAKHYNINPATIANMMGGTVASGSQPQALDEAHTVPSSSPYTVTAAQGATYVAGTMYVLGFPIVNGVANPIPYTITSGMPVAGVSCTVSAAGVVTFAAGDAGMMVQLGYKWASTLGYTATITSQVQNSAPTLQLVAAKRDISPVDNSQGELVWTFPTVRYSGMKADYKEGDFTVYERMYEAFAATPTGGTVFTTTFYNSTSTFVNA